MTDSRLPQQLPGTGWHHEDIKAELRKRFGSLTHFSTKLGVSRQAISGVLLNPMASMTLERKIAHALQVSPYAIWPLRWHPDGSPIPRSERSKIVHFVQEN